jgi:hypothetical protein
MPYLRVRRAQEQYHVGVMRVAALLIALAAAAGAAAGTVLDVEYRNESSSPYTFKGKVSIEGPNARYDVIEGAHPMFNPSLTIISRDNGETLLVIDHRQRTFFVRQARAMCGPLSTWRGPGTMQESHASVDLRRDERGDATIASRGTRMYRGHAEYDLTLTVDGQTLRAHVASDATMWMSGLRNDALPYGLAFGFKSGFDEVDHEIEHRLPRYGIPLRQVITTTRTIEGGDPITETFEARVTNVKEQKLDITLFVPPGDYELKEPTFTFE